MGMAASQARLLSLTSRLQDVELKAQNLMSQKIALATQKDELYREYCDALDATLIKVAYLDNSANTVYVDANFKSLCTYNENRLKQYTLKDNQTGHIIVSRLAEENYEKFGGDKYAFAYAMLGYNNNFNWSEATNGYNGEASGLYVGLIGKAQASDDPYLNYVQEEDGSWSLYMTHSEQLVFDKYKNSDVELNDKYNKIGNGKTKEEKQTALDNFRRYLYDTYSTEIYKNMNINKQGNYTDPHELFSTNEWEDLIGEFNYYINLWQAITNAGGCKAIDPQYESGDMGNDWFNNMVEAALITIQVYDEKGHANEWSDTSVATSTNNNYLQEMQDDKDLKRAEAEYNHELDIINRKDTKFDTELSKLETERIAITTEIDSIKSVKDDNIERTFGIFS